MKEKRWTKADLRSIAIGSFAIGAFLLIFAKGSRWYGVGFILLGIILACILQFFFGEDIIRYRRIKEIK